MNEGKSVRAGLHNRLGVRGKGENRRQNDHTGEHGRDHIAEGNCKGVELYIFVLSGVDVVDMEHAPSCAGGPGRLCEGRQPYLGREEILRIDMEHIFEALPGAGKHHNAYEKRGEQYEYGGDHDLVSCFDAALNAAEDDNRGERDGEGEPGPGLISGRRRREAGEELRGEIRPAVPYGVKESCENQN